MSDDPTLMKDAIDSVTQSPMAILVFWGALGGATNALMTKVKARAAMRLITLGSLISGGTGTMAAYFIVHRLELPTELVAAGGVLSSVGFLVGMFGTAIFDVVLGRIQRGQLPGEAKNDVQ